MSDIEGVRGRDTGPHPEQRPVSARIEPLRPEEWTDEQREVLSRVQSGGNADGLFSTVGRHPQLLRRWASFGNSLLRWGELPPRDREILVLRTASNCAANYPWGQHDRGARRLGLGEEEIERTTRPAPIGGAEESDDQVLIDAADDLHRDAAISASVWERLRARYSDAQLIELVMVVGQYHLVSFLTNSFQIEPEAGLAKLGDERPPRDR
jgi:alkylhydroperoxidase family enzyme